MRGVTELQFIAEEVNGLVHVADSESDFFIGVLNGGAETIVQHTSSGTPDAFVGRHGQSIRTNAHTIEFRFGFVGVARGLSARQCKVFAVVFLSPDSELFIDRGLGRMKDGLFEQLQSRHKRIDLRDSHQRRSLMMIMLGSLMPFL